MYFPLFYQFPLQQKLISFKIREYTNSTISIEAEELKITDLLISNNLMSTMISELSWKENVTDLMDNILEGSEIKKLSNYVTEKI
jgi:Fic family protein